MKLTATIAVFVSLLFTISAKAQNFIWSDKIGSSSYDIGSDIDTDTNGNAIVVGQFFSSITIDTISLTSAGSYDGFVAKFNTSGQVQWAISLGGTSIDEIKSVRVDKSTGDVYITGSYYSGFTIAGTTLPTSNFYGSDIFLVKISSGGVPLWAKAFTGYGMDMAADLIIDEANGYVYTFGAFDSTLTIGSTSLSSPFYQSSLFLTKFSTAGTFKWAKKFQAQDVYNTGSGLKFGGLGLLSGGDVILVSNYRSQISFNTITLNTTGSSTFTYDICIARIDTLGNTVWAQTAGGVSSDYGNDVAIDSADNIWLTGRTNGAATFGSINLTTGGTSNAFLAKYSPSGSALYAYQSGTTFTDGFGVDCDGLGNIYLIGRYYDAITFGSIFLTSVNFGSKLFIAKFDGVNSTWEWAIGPDYTGSFSPAEEGKALAVDGEDNVYVTGVFSGTIKLGTNTMVTSGSYDVFIAKIGDCSGLSAGIWAGGSTTLCSGGSVNLLADTSQFYQYQWLFNGASLPGQINASYTANQSGNYKVVIDSAGCKDTSAVIAVSVGSTPTVTQTAFASICENASPILLTGGSPSGGTYSGPGVSGNIFTPSTAGPGTHPITYTYTNSQGCSATATQSIWVTAAPFVFMLPQTSLCINTPAFALNNGIPAGGVYSGNGVVGGAIFNPSLAGIGTHKVYYTRTSGTCSSTDSLDFVVYGVPNVNLNPLSDVCISTTFIPLFGGSPSGGVYSGSGVSSPFFFPIAAGAGPHLITYTVTQNGCSSSDTATIHVDTVPNPIMAPLPQLCETDADLDLSNYAFPTGGTFSGPAVVGSNFSPSIHGTGTSTIVYTVSNACGSDTAQRSVTVLASPTVTIPSFPSVCINAGIQPLSGGLPLGGTYSGVGVSGGTFNPAIAGSGTHSITYSYTNSQGCADSATSSIVIHPLPTVTLPSLGSLCIDAGVQILTGGLPAGGTYFGTGVSGSTFDPNVSGTGTFQIGYAYADANSCADTAYQNITVNPLPTVTLSAFSAVCVDAATFALSGGLPAGGTYFGTGISAGNFNPATAGVGMHQIGYAYADANSCADTAYQNIIVNPLPTVTLSAFSAVCVDAATFALSGGLPAGGTYFGTGVSAGNFSPATAGAGTHQIGYAYADANACADTAYQNIVVNPLPTVTLSALGSICIDAGVQTLTGGLPAGGTYFGTGVSGSTFDPNVSGTGTFQIGYAYADANSCADTAYQNITVNPLPTVTLSAFSAVCVDAATFALSGGLPAGGTYFGTGISAGNFNPATAGVGMHQIGYAYADANSCADTAYQNIIVNPLPTVTLSAFSAVCVDAATFALSGGLPAGGTYFGTGVSAGNFSPATAGAGTHQIGYAYADANACADTAYQNIVVNPLPTVTLSALGSICIDAGVQTLTGGLPAGGTYFGTGVSGSTFDPNVSGTGTFQIGYAYADANSCADTAYQNITVNPLPTVTLSAFSAVCVDAATFALSGGLPAGGTYFGTGVSAGNFNPATAGVGTHQIGYAYADANSCADTAFQNIIVNPLPTVTLSAFSAVCVDAATFALSGGLPAGGTYFGTGVSAGNFSPATAGAGTHQIGYAYADANACADTAYQNIVVNPLPTVTLSALGSICIDAGVQILTGGLPAGGTYFGTGVSGSTFDPNVSGTGTFQIGYAYADANSCADTAYQNITVNPLPTVTLSAFSAVCVDAATFALSGGLPAGGTYFGTGISAGNFNPATAGVGMHQIGYAYADANSCADTAYQNIIVNPLPTVTLSAFSAVCVDAATFALSGGLPAGGTYFGTGVSAGNFSPATAGAGTHQIGYAYADANACADTAYQNIVVNPLPTVTLSALGSICIDAGVQTLTGGLPAGGTYFGTGVSGSTFDPNVSGTGTFQIGYAYADANSCADTAYQNITVNPLPTVTLSAFSAVCVDAATFALSGGLPAGGTYFGTGISAGNFNPATAGVGTHQIGYAYADANSCADTAFQNITVNPLPTVTLSAFSAVCVDAATFALSGGLPAGGTYFGTGVSAGNFSPATAGAGTHQIGYAYADANSCADTAYQNIVVNALPVVAFSIADTSCENAAPIALNTGLPVGGVYLVNGTQSSSFDPNVAGSGTSIITYQFTDANGCFTQVEDSIYVRPEPVISFPSISDVCEDLPAFQFPVATPIGGVYSTGGNMIGADSFDVSNSGVGAYSVIYTITDQYGCFNNASQSFDVNPLPVVTFDLSTDSICEYTPVYLDGQFPLGGVFSGNQVLGDTIFTADLDYDQVITYSYTDSNGCVSSVDDHLWVYPDPGIKFNPDTLRLCQGAEVDLSFADPAGGTFTSPFIDFATGMFIAPDSAFFGQAGIYAFGNVCGFDMDTFYLVVNDLPVVNLGNDTSICENQQFALDAGLQTTYLWNDSSASRELIVNTTQTAGDTTIWVEVGDELGCKSADTINVFVAERRMVDLGADISACIDSSFAISVNTPYEHFVWNTGDTTFSIAINNPVAYLESETIYWVTGSDSNGCSFTDSVTVSLIDCDTIFNADWIKIYPNPVHDKLSLDIPGAKISNVSGVLFINDLGKIVENVEINGFDSQTGEFDINVDNLASGVYFLIVRGDDWTKTFTVVVY